jgi:replication factor A1
MASMSLTPNAVREVVAAGKQDPNFQPICQIINIKNVTNKASSSGQPSRFRVIISDGECYIQGMLATQLNNLIESNQLQTHNTVRIKQFMVNGVKGKTLVVVLGLDILDTSIDYKIGTPVDVEKAGAIANTNSNSNAGAGPMYNRTNTNSNYGSNNNNNDRNYSPPKKNNPYNSNQSPGSRNPYSPNGSNRSSGSNAPIVHKQNGSGHDPRITPIMQLNMYQNRFTIKGRVTSKSEIKHWSNARGEGTLSSFEVLDAGGTDIRITMFKEAVDKWHNYFEIGQVYTIGGGRLKVANQKYNNCKSNYEMTIDENAEIHKCEDSKEIQSMLFEFCKIGNLEERPENSFVDVIGVVQEVGEVQSLTSKRTGQELKKSDVTLIDDTGVQVRLTLWGNTAVEASNKLDGGSNKKVVAFRRARVSDYGGKTLSGGDVFVEPDCPETEDIRRWWSSQGSRSAPVKSLSSSGGAGGRMDGFNDRKMIADIKGQQLGESNEKGDYLTFKAHFTFLKKDKEGGAWYTACPLKDEPCRNRCKINQTTDGSYHCDRCNGTYPNCNRKWIFSGTVGDGTSNTWVSIFDEQAQELLGTTADEMYTHFESNQEVYDAAFAKAAFTEWLFKCRVKKELVNDEYRTKVQVMRMEHVNYASECRDMIAALERM